MSEEFTRLKESRILSRHEFEGFKSEATKKGISFNELTRKQVKFAGSVLTAAVLYTFDGNPINAANTNIFLIAEQPLIDWKAKAEEANLKIEDLQDKIKELESRKKPKKRRATA